MLKKIIIITAVLAAIVLAFCCLFPICEYTTLKKSQGLGIVRRPEMQVYSGGIKTDIPKFNPNSSAGFQVDLRNYDLSSLDLSDKAEDLFFADFDSKTKWPEKMPEAFKPEEIMSLGKTPGLNVQTLHTQGIDGRGVGIAIIDQALLIDHVEYKDQLKLYEEIHNVDNAASMHGPAVASIAVGKTVGVAPKADLYYIAETHADIRILGYFVNYNPLAESIYRIIEINKTLPPQNRIRVISISKGWSKIEKGYQEVTKAVEKANQEGIFVVSCALYQTYGFSFDGLGRYPPKSPDNILSYSPSIYCQYSIKKDIKSMETDADTSSLLPVLLVPMDSRTIASPNGTSDYAFNRKGGWSWAVPYIAGLYALACQVKPEITPQQFWEAALQTGDPLSYKYDGRDFGLGYIANPVKLIEAVKKL